MNKKIPHANRGKSFEKLIDESNKAYEFQELALVQKIPNEWTIIRRGREIVSAFSRDKSTVDYIGIAFCKALSFEAKSTVNKTSFPLANIKPHQIQYLTKFGKMGGTAFFLINFATFDRTFLLPIEKYLEYTKNNSAKSIPLSYFEEHTNEVYSAATIPIDYLKVLYF